LKFYIFFSAIFFDFIRSKFIRLKFFGTFYSQVANLSASEGDKLFQKRKWRRPSFGSKEPKILGTIIHDKHRLRSGRQPRLQASPQSIRKSVPGGEKNGVIVLALVVAPSQMPGSAGPLAVSDKLRI